MIRNDINPASCERGLSELHAIYLERGGTASHISRLITRINDHLDHKLYVFKADGLSSIIMHREKASKMLNVVKQKSEVEDIELRNITNKIGEETQQVPKLKNSCPVLNNDLMDEISLPTLEAILGLIGPNLESRKLKPFINSMMASSVTLNFTMPQVVLDLLVQDKRLVQHLYEYRVTASYDEI